MKHFVFLFLLFLCSSHFCTAQDFSTTISEETELTNKALPSKILGEKNGHLYLLRAEWSPTGARINVFIEKYVLPEFKLVSTNKIKMPDNSDGKETLFQDVFFLKGNLILISDYSKDHVNFFTTKRCTYSTYASIINEDGSLSKSATVLSEDEFDLNLIKLNRNNFICSEDNNAIYMTKGYIQDNKILGVVVDHELNVFQNINLDLSFKRPYSISSFLLSNNHFYFFSKEEADPSEWPNKDFKKYSYRVFNYDLQTRTSKMVPVKLNETLPLAKTFLQFSENDKNILYLTAYHSNDTEDKTKSKGYMTFIKMDDAFLEEKEHFEIQFNSNAIHDISINSSYYDISVLRTKAIIETNDGGYIITSAISSSESMFIQFISNSKKLLSTTCIHTGHMRGDLYGDMNIHFYKNNKLYFVFNDSKKNLEVQDGKLKEEYYDLKNDITVLVTVDKNGKWTKSQLFSRDKQSLRLYPQITFLKNKNEIITVTQKDKRFQFITFKY